VFNEKNIILNLKVAAHLKKFGHRQQIAGQNEHDAKTLLSFLEQRSFQMD